MRNNVPMMALETPYGKGTFLDLAGEVLDISDHGLNNRARRSNSGENEQGFLQILKTSVKQGKCPADEILEAYSGPWNQNIDKIFDELSY